MGSQNLSRYVANNSVLSLKNSKKQRLDISVTSNSVSKSSPSFPRTKVNGSNREIPENDSDEEDSSAEEEDADLVDESDSEEDIEEIDEDVESDDNEIEPMNQMNATFSDEDDGDDDDDNEDEESALSKSQRKRQKQQSLYRAPTFDELTTLRETASLYKSNLFKMQLDELLLESSPFLNPESAKSTFPVEKFLHSLKACLDSIEPVTNLNVKDALKLCKDKSVVMPLSSKIPDDVMYTLGFDKPENVVVVGSFLLKTVAKSRGGMNVDLAIMMPSEKDHMNNRYFHKRAFYLAMLAATLRDSKLNVDVEFQAFQGDLRKSVIVLHSKGDGGATDFSKSGFRIRLLPAVSPSIFPTNRLAPSKNNIRTSDPAKNATLPPTPVYNTLILQDMCFVPHLNYLHSQLSNSTEFRDACIIAKNWLNQRGMYSPVKLTKIEPKSMKRKREDKETKSEECGRDGVVFNGFLFSMVMAYLLNVPVDSKTGKKKLMKNFSSYQMFKLTLEFLATNDFDANPIVMTPDGKFLSDPEYSEEIFKGNFEVLMIDPSGRVNLAAGMSRSVLDEIQYEARLSSTLLNDTKSDNFSALFLQKIDNPLLRFDNVFRVVLPNTSPSSVIPGALLDFPSSEEHLRTFIPSLLKKGLSSRCNLITVSSLPKSSWACNYDISEHSQSSILFIQLILDPQASLRVVEHGPQTDVSTPEAVKQFRELWGPKAELRRFRDGTIRESVVFDDDVQSGPGSSSIENRSVIVARMVGYLLERHVWGINSSSIVHWVGEVGKVLKEHDTIAALNLLAEGFSDDAEKLGMARSAMLGGETFQQIIDSFEKFARELKNLEDLPLGIISVIPCCSALRYSSVFLPQPAHRVTEHEEDFDDEIEEDSQKPIRLRDVLEVNIEFEGSASWPDELEAIAKMKMAFLIRISKEIAKHMPGYKTQIINKPNDCAIDITPKVGYTYRCRIFHEREGMLYQRKIIQSKVMSNGTVNGTFAPQQSGNVEILKSRFAAYTRQFEHIPTHTARIQRLCQIHPHLSLSIRLFKRWLSSHMLLSRSHISEEVAETIAVAVYINSTQFGWSSPANGECGFIRCLWILKDWEWEFRPLFVALNEAARDNGTPEDPVVSGANTETASLLEKAEKVYETIKKDGFEGMFIVTDLDVDGKWWNQREKLTVQIKKTVRGLAKSALKCLEGIMSPPSTTEKSVVSSTLLRLFVTPMSHYDVLIKLSPLLCPRYGQAILFDPRVFPVPEKPRTQKVRKYKNLPRMPKKSLDAFDSDNDEDGEINPIVYAKLRKVLLEGFDPVSRYVQELEKIFGQIADIFVDECGGTVIGVIFNRKQLGVPEKSSGQSVRSATIPWKVNLEMLTEPVDEDGEENGNTKKMKKKGSQAGRVRVHGMGIVSEMVRLGAGVVETVDIVEEWKDV
ncbi:hypothetical protein HK098_002248 [Nowakowskiella sp. JEL0407]|nr:hypothetical protein HK098_002248 [Nowakowskiella sp. JEL0407]